MSVRVDIRKAAVWDPKTRRHRAPCPACEYVAVRAKKDAALHVLAQHLAYRHGADT